MLIRDSIFAALKPINNRMLRKPHFYLFVVLSLALAGCSNAIPKFKVEGGGNGVVIQRTSAHQGLVSNSGTGNLKLKGHLHFAQADSLRSNSGTGNYVLKGAIKREGITK